MSINPGQMAEVTVICCYRCTILHFLTTKTPGAAIMEARRLGWDDTGPWICNRCYRSNNENKN